MPDRAIAEAPGRVNLIGEHTDYHEGYVLPAVIPLRTRVDLERRPDRLVRARSAAMSDPVQEYELGRETRGRGWVDFVQGVTAVLAHGGAPLTGFDAEIDSTIPVGAGVSSSAALAVSLLRALRSLLDIAIDDVEIARIAHKVETDFVGAPVGVMDQMACSLGRDGEALFIDTRTLAFERVPMPPTIDIVVIDSGISHQHAGGAYQTRRHESFEAATALGVATLRDVSPRELRRLHSLPDTLARRARHVLTENARVLEAVDALRSGDGRRLGALFNASHRSMRDDFEVSTPEIDMLVGIAEARPDVYGARLTGGGFGGAIVVAAHPGAGSRAAGAIAAEYGTRAGRRAMVLCRSGHRVDRPGGGADRAD